MIIYVDLYLDISWWWDFYEVHQPLFVCNFIGFVIIPVIADTTNPQITMVNTTVLSANPAAALGNNYSLTAHQVKQGYHQQQMTTVLTNHAVTKPTIPASVATAYERHRNAVMQVKLMAEIKAIDLIIPNQVVLGSVNQPLLISTNNLAVVHEEESYRRDEMPANQPSLQLSVDY